MRNRWTIAGGRIVMPGGILDGHTLVIEDGVIQGSRPDRAADAPADLNVNGAWIMPGMIDSHSDAIENEMQPRPTSRFPIELSFMELERKLAAQGITTIYHSLSMLDDESNNWARRNDNVAGFIRKIRELAGRQRLIHHKLHLRFEITNLKATAYAEAMLAGREIDQISFMDHTPGQGQWRNFNAHKALIQKKRNMSDEEVEKLFDARRNLPKLSGDELQRLADLAYSQGIPVASHDDDDFVKVERAMCWKATIAEFPITLDVAKEAKAQGMHVAMGAPNVLLGGSHSNNLSALEAIEAGVVDILCSDYYPSSMLQAVFLLHGKGMPIHEAVNLVSYHPAKALGIEQQTGSLQAGRDADLLVVQVREGKPVIEKVFVGGHIVCEMNYWQTSVRQPV